MTTMAGRPMAPIGLALLAFHRLQRGELAAARPLMEQAEPQLASLPRDVRWLPTVTAMGRASVLAGNSAMVGWCYAAISPYEDRYLMSGSGMWGSVSYFLGRFADAVGDVDRAVRHLDDAARMEAGVGGVVHQARTEAAYAQLLLRRGAAGDLGRAERLAMSARRAAEQYRMPYLAADTQSVLDAVSGKMREPAAALTAREREIVGLVAAGRSNREVARRLVLSERTVETHVRNALMKLGLANRTQLAAWAAQVGLAEPSSEVT